MQEIYIEQVGRVTNHKKRLKKELEVVVTNKGKNIFIEGDGDKEYTAMQVLEALKLGFSIERALALKDEEIILQTVHIKDITKRNDLETVRSRIIGSEGKTLRTLNNLTNCAISLEDNEVGIIGYADEIEDAIQAIKSIIQGSKQSNVYSRVEKQRKRKRNLDKIPIKKD
jgi:KH domain-containing protein